MTTAVFSSMFGQLVKPHASDLRDTPTQPQQRKARTAFDGPGGTSAVTLAVKPRQAAYKAGPGISVTNSAQGRRDAEMRRVMRLTRI